MAPGINVEALSLRRGENTLFRSLELRIAGGTVAVLLGASGVGKSSLLRVVAGLERPDAGRVTASDGRPLAGRIAMMAQTDGLLPWLDAIGNVSLGARLRGERVDRARAARLLDDVGLAGRERARPAELSGGQRGRVALARTLYEDRPVVLMDEPFAGLDSITRTRMQALAARLLRGRTVLLITHDAGEACRIGDTLLLLRGAPARLDPPVALDGPTPRAPDDPAVLRREGELLRALAAAA